jgi:hypothetical protein
LYCPEKPTGISGSLKSSEESGVARLVDPNNIHAALRGI